MVTKKSWMLPASKRADLGAFFSQLWALVCAFGSPPEPGSPDDDQFWQCLVEAVGEAGQKHDADHDRLIARFLIALMEGVGDLQADRPGGLMEDVAS